MITITADSTADLNELYSELGIPKIALAVNLGSTEYLDGETVSPQDIFKFVSENKILPKTAARSIDDYIDFFKAYVDKGEEIIHISISSKLSASYDNAVKAAEGMKNVYVIDGLNLSSGTGLLILYADELRRNGKSANEIIELVAKRVPYVQASFVVDTMEYLKKGGRCSGVKALVAGVLKIKPSIIVKNGGMIVGKKYMGNYNKVILKYIDDTFSKFSNPDLTHIFITHSCAEKETIDLVINRIKSLKDFKNIHITTAGATITSHCGKGTLGILYINDCKE